MTASRVQTPPTARTGKREAILLAAFEVFGREGYARASVDEIARLAGIAKPTLYSRFGDKATLFTEAVSYVATLSNQRVMDVIDAVSTQPCDLRDELEQLGIALVGCVMHEDGAATVRLQMTEHATFGEKFDQIRTNNRKRTLDRLAGKLAQLATIGQLALTDPQRAARHFLALVSDDALARSGYGTTVLTAADVAGSVADAVDTFLAAFSPQRGAKHRAPGRPRAATVRQRR